MKIVLILLGALGGIYAAAGTVVLGKTMLEQRADSAIGASITAASVVPVCVGLIVCIVCFQRAFRKPNP